MVHWNIHGSDINITWEESTLEYVAKGIDTFPRNYNIIRNPAEHQWSYWLVQNLGSVPHPMHLHGHDFLILGRSKPVPNPISVTVAEFNSTYAFQAARDTASLNFVNPTRRDVTMLPSWGWGRAGVPHRQPGRLADALPHCVAYFAGTRRAIPRARR